METISKESFAVSIKNEIFVVDPTKLLKIESAVIAKSANNFIFTKFPKIPISEILGICCYRISEID